ncbi:hypothetical protein VTP01DRAFT_3121 [Rhizomucor pusillus]|uniref:uncharacterized protein n=1 Tax=Rhizomucor pusillus TaxID=4840 RepID=UPI003743D13E
MQSSTDPSSVEKETRRAHKLDTLHEKFTKHLLHQLNYNAFKETLGEICDEHHEDFKCAHIQIRDYLQEQMKKHYERVKAEYNVAESFKTLDHNIELARSDPQRARQRTVPTPEQVIRSIRVKEKLKLLERLRKTEADVKEENSKLMNEIMEKDKELEQTMEDISADISQFEEAARIANSIDVQQMEQTIRYLDSSL